MDGGVHQFTVAVLLVIGCIKFILGYYAIRVGLVGQTIRTILRRPSILFNFAFMLGLTKTTSDALLYAILSWEVGTADGMIPIWQFVYLVYSLSVNLLTFIRWSEESSYGR